PRSTGKKSAIDVGGSNRSAVTTSGRRTRSTLRSQLHHVSTIEPALSMNVGHQLEGADLAGLGVGEVLDPGHAEEDLDLGQGGLEERDGVPGGLGHRDLT